MEHAALLKTRNSFKTNGLKRQEESTKRHAPQEITAKLRDAEVDLSFDRYKLSTVEQIVPLSSRIKLWRGTPM